MNIIMILNLDQCFLELDLFCLFLSVKNITLMLKITEVSNVPDFCRIFVVKFLKLTQTLASLLMFISIICCVSVVVQLISDQTYSKCNLLNILKYFKITWTFLKEILHKIQSLHPLSYTSMWRCNWSVWCNTPGDTNKRQGWWQFLINYERYRVTED